MEYKEVIEKDTVVRITTTHVPVCEFCGDEAEFMEEYSCDIAWCACCVDQAYSYIAEEYVGYQFVADCDSIVEVEYENEEE